MVCVAGFGEGSGYGYIKCCVPGCTDTTSPRHRFPNPNKDKDRFESWLRAINNDALFALDPQTIYNVKRVCHRHFASTDYTMGNQRLHLNAIPRLFLPEVPAESSEPINGAANVPSTSYMVQEEKNEPQPSTSASNGDQHIPVVPKNKDGRTEQSQEPTGDDTLYEPSTSRGKTHLSRVTPYSLMTAVGLNPRQDFTPKKKIMYGVVKRLVKNLKKTSVTKQSFRRRLFQAEKFANDRHLEANLGMLNSVAAQFFRSQLREANKPSKQHRFTNDEKILSLTLYRQSPKCYKFLAKIFILPSKSTLNKFLDEIDINAGINPITFEALKKASSKLDPLDKYVSILFDEMSLMPSVTFNEKKGNIEGFEDMGEGKRSSAIADHVLVFMVRGLRKSFKEPISYHFSVKGGASYVQIKSLLTEIIRNLLDVGFKPITTICDQAKTNCKVIKSLMEDTKADCLRREEEYREGYFQVNGWNIYPIYDPPHLLKGIRNNFINRPLQFGVGSTKKIARWSHIQKLYECDNAPTIAEGLKTLPHLTDDHIYEKNMKKMKVKLAAQIFSQRLSSTLLLASRLDKDLMLGQGTEDTAELLYFFDRLFDSVNGCQKRPTRGKSLRCGISDDSPHLQFWQNEALPLLATMQFVQTRAQEQQRPPSLENWMFTIRNLMKIWHILKEAGFKYLLGRNFNQDPLENTFGQIRSHGGQFNTPNAATFIGSFKTIIINSSLNFYKSSFNCENDECELMFDGLKCLFGTTRRVSQAEEVVEGHVTSPADPPPLQPNTIETPTLSEQLAEQAENYTAGFILKSVKKMCLNCQICQKTIFSQCMDKHSQLIAAREFGGGWAKRLCYPSVPFVKMFSQIREIIADILKNHNCALNLVAIMKKRIKASVNMSFMTCENHKLSMSEAITKICIRTLVHAWCKRVNRKIVGKDRRPYNGDDPVMIYACKMYFNRHRK